MDVRVRITGHDLDPETLVAIARDRVRVEIDPSARRRMQDANAVVLEAARAGTPVYGLTTGLGSRVTDTVEDADGSAFSLRTLRGRATSVGEPLSPELTRAAMAVRLNGLCTGGAGAAPEIADGLAALLNAEVHPRIPGSGSVGASDLCLLAHVGLTLIGEGDAELDGDHIPSADALKRSGLAPVALGPKDGLAICSSSAVCIGVAGLALIDAEACLEAAQSAAALSMEGFRANLSPLDPRVVAARPAPGQAWAAEGLRARLAGGALATAAAAAAPRRLQDPLSFRCVSQIHGSLRMALDLLSAALAPELGGAADNPVVLAADGEILSNGNFHVPALALALDATAIALAQVAGAIAERQVRLNAGRLSGLAANLTTLGPGHSGLGPLSKTAHALALEIRHRASPLAIQSTIGADSVEDDSTAGTQAALRVGEQLQRLRLLVAVELVAGAQAVELAAPEQLGAGTGAIYRCVRDSVAPLDEDRPLGPDVERLAARALGGGELARRVASALSQVR